MNDEGEDCLGSLVGLRKLDFLSSMRISGAELEHWKSLMMQGRGSLDDKDTQHHNHI